MRILVSGAGGFVGAHVESEVERQGHVLASATDAADAVIHLSPARVRAALDEAWARGARSFVLLSTVGANAEAREETRAAAGRAEELVQASGLRWAALRPELLWGPGDVFTNELASLLRHLPFVPVARGGVKLAPVHVSDAAAALLWLAQREEAMGRAWSLRGPEELRYGQVIERVALAIFGQHRRRLPFPAWSVRWGASLEERAGRRPRLSRELVDWRVGVEISARVPPLPGADARRVMSVEALREYLGQELRPEEQVSI
jgi:nucleoside-diphosphate-sugar epimerase